MPLDPPLLKLRCREAMIPSSDPEHQRPIVEVLKDGEVVGQLPATKAVYTMGVQDIGRLTIEVFAARAEVTGHD